MKKPPDCQALATVEVGSLDTLARRESRSAVVLVLRLQRRLCLARIAAAACKVLVLKSVIGGDRAKARAAGWRAGSFMPPFTMDSGLHAAACLGGAVKSLALRL